jgi:hypothetical protein
MDAIPQSTLLGLCALYGPQLRVPSGVNGFTLMVALAYNESSLGQNCKPRYERSYDEGGANDQNEQTELIEKYGKAAACSYGPWQMMPCNAPGFSPQELYASPDACAKAFVAFFNRYVIGHCGAKSVSDVAQVWNGGHVSTHPNPGVQRYQQQLLENYEKAKAVTFTPKVTA